MQIELSYGRGMLAVELPDGLEVTVIRKPAMPVLSDPAGAIHAALARPAGARPLVEEARGKKTACILICDITRPVPNALLLQPLIRELLAAGVPASGITVLVATGLHRPNLGAELEELIGDPWVKPMRVGRVQLYCGGPVDRVLTGVSAIDSVERAVLDSARAMRDAHVAVIPEGPYVVPFYQPVNRGSRPSFRARH